jgi:uncharacterized membrane protein YgcG
MLLDRVGDRLEVKIEHEIRHMSVRDRELKVDRLVPLIRKMASTEEGLKDLAAIAASYLKEHRPETTVVDDAKGDGASAGAPVARESDFLPRKESGYGGGGRSGGGGGGRRRGGRGGRR